MNPIVCLTIAGSDSGAGAGAQADLKTFAALGAFGTTAITAVTAQNTAEVRAVLPVGEAMVDAQISAVLDDFDVAAVKTGMLAESTVVSLLARRARAGELPNLVVDPVLVASTGQRLTDDDALARYRDELVPLAVVATPNLREAALLTGIEIADEDAMVRAARRLAEGGARVVVVKGGHLAGKRAPDVVVSAEMPDEPVWLVSERIATANDHGTGCTLAAAIAVFLGREVEPVEAVRRAKAFVEAALLGAASWRLGNGHGPLDHFGWGAAGGVGGGGVSG